MVSMRRFGFQFMSRSKSNNQWKLGLDGVKRDTKKNTGREKNSKRLVNKIKTNKPQIIWAYVFRWGIDGQMGHLGQWIKKTGLCHILGLIGVSCGLGKMRNPRPSGQGQLAETEHLRGKTHLKSLIRHTNSQERSEALGQYLSKCGASITSFRVVWNAIKCRFLGPMTILFN